MKAKARVALSLLALCIVAGAVGAFSMIRENRQWELSRAAAAGDLATVKRLVEAGVSVNAAPTSEAGGGSPAFVATAWGGHDKVISFLLDHGAHIDRRDSTGNTALNAAAMRGHLSTAKLLLSRGANPNIGGEGRPLWNAHARDDAKMADLLKAHGAAE